MTEQKKRRPSYRFITPKGVAIYPNLHKPSEKFGKYEARIRVPESDEFIEKLRAKLQPMLDSFVAETEAELKAKGGQSARKAKEIKVKELLTLEYDDNGDETGNVLLKGTLKASGERADGTTYTQAPTLIDSKGKEIKGSKPAVYGGSVLKLGLKASPYYSPANNEVGMSYTLEAAQILKLVSGGGGGSYDFGQDEDGEYEAEDESAGGFRDESSEPKDENEEF